MSWTSAMIAVTDILYSKRRETYSRIARMDTARAMSALSRMFLPQSGPIVVTWKSPLESLVIAATLVAAAFASGADVTAVRMMNPRTPLAVLS